MQKSESLKVYNSENENKFKMDIMVLQIGLPSYDTATENDKSQDNFAIKIGVEQNRDLRLNFKI